MDLRSDQALMARLFYCDHYDFPLPPGHKFPREKYRLIRQRLAADGLFHFVAAPPAPREAIERAHCPSYVERFLNGTLAASAMRRIGFPWSPALVARTLASAGGTLQAAFDAVDTGFGANLAGGTHHAFHDHGSGFCVFNDVAIAIHDLRARGLASRAAVLDLDVHQGDGTARLFEHDREVLTVSLHGRNNFPLRKQRSRIDVELEDGTGDEEYLRALDAVLPRVLDFGPQIVFYQSGVDPLASDRLGRLALTQAGLRLRDRRVMKLVKQAALPFVITLGGGYSEPISLTVEAHANTFRAAAEFWGR